MVSDQDILEQRAMYIVKNNELNQEFYYAHPKTKIWINNVYNTSLYGAPLWDMFSRNFEKLEKTWNVSIRTMLSIPRNTHEISSGAFGRNSAHHQVPLEEVHNVC